jgi:DNA-directed RNA polymerase I, II, and III subunit RPABC2
MDDDYDVELNFENNDLSDDEDIIDVVEEDETDDNKINIITYNDILENIKNNPKRTLPIMTKFEKARIIGVRLQQLASGAKPRVDISNMRDINEIVNEELKQRKIPLIICRPLPNGIIEYWKMEEFIG